jgi:hypothetical protein
MMDGILWPVLGMLACFSVMCLMMMAAGRFFSGRQSGETGERESVSTGSPSQER